MTRYEACDLDLRPVLLFCENDTDAINDAIVGGRFERIDTDGGGKAAAHLQALVHPGETFIVDVRLSAAALPRPFAGFDASMDLRRREANEFYAEMPHAGLSEAERLAQCQALAAQLWSGKPVAKCSTGALR